MMLFTWNVIELGVVYRIFKKKHLIFDDRFIKTMCMAITMNSTLVLALYFELLLPSIEKTFFLLPIFIGLFIGWKFSAIMKAPATLTGIYNGSMGGIMGTMLGAVLKNPALCNIPIESETMIATNIYSIAIFAACLHALISHLIRYSFKV